MADFILFGVTTRRMTATRHEPAPTRRDTSTSASDGADRPVFWAALCFGLLPFVLTLKLPPSASFWAEWTAALCSIALLLIGWRAPASAATHHARLPVAALALLLLVTLVAVQLLADLPGFAGTAFLAILLTSLAAWLCGTAATWQDRAPQILDGLALGLVLALGVNFTALLLELAGWHLHALTLFPSPFLGRASALVGQPNQMAIFAVMAWCAAFYLWWRGRLPAWAHALASVLVACLVSTAGSRSGSLAWLLALGLAMLALRGHADQRAGRRLLWLAVAVFAAAQAAWGPGGLAGHFLSSDAGSGAVTSIVREGREGRLELWRDSLQLIASHPWFGVGWGNFSAARWSELSTPLLEPNMGHAHNLVLNLAVELGIPATLLVLLPFGWALWRAVRAGLRPNAPASAWLVASLLLVLSTYSLLEFPLWHAHFLLPFALLLGLANGPGIGLPVGRLRRPAHLGLGLVAATLVVLVGLDYRRTEQVYTDAARVAPGADRTTASLPVKKVSEIALLTTIDLYADLMLLRVLDLDGLFTREKLRLSERVMGGLTTKETVARHIAFLVAAGQQAEADKVFARTARNPNLRVETVTVLTQLAQQQPALKAYVQALSAPLPLAQERPAP
jgi:O-antigen ligase